MTKVMNMRTGAELQTVSPSACKVEWILMALIHSHKARRALPAQSCRNDVDALNLRKRGSASEEFRTVVYPSHCGVKKTSVSSFVVTENQASFNTI